MPSKPGRITNGQRAAVCGLVIAGVSMTQACLIVGAPRALYLKYLPPKWHKQKPRPSIWFGERLDDLRDAYMDPSQRTRTIAQRYGVHVSFITHMARKHGWPVRLPANVKKPNSIRTMTPQQRTIYFKLRHIMPRASAVAEATR